MLFLTLSQKRKLCWSQTKLGISRLSVSQLKDDETQQTGFYTSPYWPLSHCALVFPFHFLCWRLNIQVCGRFITQAWSVQLVQFPFVSAIFSSTFFTFNDHSVSWLRPQSESCCLCILAACQDWLVMFRWHYWSAGREVINWGEGRQTGWPQLSAATYSEV